MALLALAATLVVVVNEYRPSYGGPHGRTLSLNHLAVAVNLSAEHGFLGYLHRTRNAAGDVVVAPYNRWPVGGTLLLWAAVAPFDDPLAQIAAAQRLALGFFAAAMLLGYLALQRMTAPWVALAATLLAFSSFHPLRFAAVTTTEAAMDLFAVMLAFHGLVLFALAGRFPQLLAKTGVALLLGWQVYALLIPFIGLTAARVLWRGGRDGGTVRARLVRLRCSRMLGLGAGALAFGVVLLALNVAREHAAVRAGDATTHLAQQYVQSLADLRAGRVPCGAVPLLAQLPVAGLAELPSVESMCSRLGLTSAARTGQLGQGWRTVALVLLARVGRASIPFAAEHLARLALHRVGSGAPHPPPKGRARAATVVEGDYRGGEPTPATRAEDAAAGAVHALLRIGGGIALVAGIVAVAYSRHRVLFASLVMVPFCWAALVPTGSAAHHFYGMFLVGLPMTVIAVALTRVRHAAPAAALAALLVFAASVLAMAGRSANEADVLRAWAADYQAMRDLVPAEATIVATGHRRRSARFFLPGRIYVTREQERACACADFVLAHAAAHAHGLLTPDNERLFLYDAAALREARPQAGICGPQRSDDCW